MTKSMLIIPGEFVPANNTVTLLNYRRLKHLDINKDVIALDQKPDPYIQKVLETKDLCKTYIVDKYSNNVLQNINFSVEEGQFVSVMGPSGSGKSTLLYTVSGMDNITSGQVVFDHEDLSKMMKLHNRH